MAVCTANLEDYRAMQKALEVSKFPFYTFKDPTATPLIKVVIRHLPTSTSIDEIEHELMEGGFPIINVAQMRKRGSHNGAPLPLFVVTLKESEASKKIMDLKSLLYVKISVERYNKPKVPTQCFRCQRFHHVSGQCRIDECCVKCAGAHASSTCTKTPETPGTCANCDGAHTASYRGCPEYKRVKATINRVANKSPPKKQHPKVPATQPTSTKHEEFPPLRESKQKTAARKSYKEAPNSTPIKSPKAAPRIINNTPVKPPAKPTVNALTSSPTKHTDNNTENNFKSESMFDVINHIKQTNQLVQSILSGKLTREEAIKLATNLCCKLVELALQNGSFA